MAIRPEEIAAVIKQQIEQFGAATDAVEVGTVVEAGDGIARVYGLRGAMYSELIRFPNDVMGMALNLEEDTVGAIILGDYTGIREGDEVRSHWQNRGGPGGGGSVGAGRRSIGAAFGWKGQCKVRENSAGRTNCA